MRGRTDRFGEYAIASPLARGGMGGVYLAHHVVSGEPVALKVIDPQFATHRELVARLHAEHALASRVAHPGVVEIRAARTASDGTPYLVMEYLAGETLAALADRAPLPLGKLVDLAAQVAEALAALHVAGVVHCDVKPENVFVTGRRAKVLDFGVSRATGADGEAGNDAGEIAGTPWCMAPEQWRGRPEPASDVYALGCVLYDLLTGGPPFEGSLPALMTAHLEQRPARPSWLAAMPAALDRLILRALAKRPEDRPTMAAVARELRALDLADDDDCDACESSLQMRAAG